MDAIAGRIARAEDAWTAGSYAEVAAELGPCLDDADAWAALAAAPERASELVYRAAISALQVGDVDDSARWFAHIPDSWPVPGAIRRGQAQVHLVRGELDAVDELLDLGPEAEPSDLAIALSAAGRRGDAAAVQALGARAFEAIESAAMHPWTLADLNLLVGEALVETGDGTKAMVTANNALDLLAGAPEDLATRGVAWIVAAGAYRLHGDLDEADRALSQEWDLIERTPGDLGRAQREAGRCYLAAGHPAEAGRWFALAAASFDAAGDRWLAGRARDECDEATRRAADG